MQRGSSKATPVARLFSGERYVNRQCYGALVVSENGRCRRINHVEFFEQELDP
ncbi:hypothetical protein ASPZODRAFT_129689 [Penicilliopsis zonata CBS 506.65]|uniref:Uncharacterized protein n=1 Tax=Penicilliopsis zonata CBS 506.65 TaxID=1073090 RepID=A0A1L9SQA3_9EURO|nr:hypothetical protein ASPZODRAFT_129689 [Penicilliopsis zonata CBS 506.65]OJJ49267.1 hypothetical protein ASPZODRAFT_129689 [Penicilliopsis zonata CBS 506.65]